jgi:dTDP-4-amino-4,6-dideoxygalactose transaminase
MKIPRLDLTVADADVLDIICDDVREVILSGRYIGGPHVQSLERELTEYFDRPVVTVGNGTDAITAALMALPAKPPHVIVPTFSFSATASAVLRAGLHPIFVDIDPETYCIDWNLVRTYDCADAVVIPVHLYGRMTLPPKDLESTVLEDACQAFGATAAPSRKAGTIGTFAAFSFFPSKPLGCYGDGGAVVCKDENLAERVRMVARHGAKKTYISEIPGFNSRLDAIQAAILRAKLSHVERQRQRRLEIASIYLDQLGGVEGLTLPSPVMGCSAWSCYVVRVHDGKRNRVLAYLREQGIDAVVQYPTPLHNQPAFASKRTAKFPHAERAAQEVLSLPIWAGMTEEQIDYVIETVKTAMLECGQEK